MFNCDKIQSTSLLQWHTHTHTRARADRQVLMDVSGTDVEIATAKMSRAGGRVIIHQAMTGIMTLYSANPGGAKRLPCRMQLKAERFAHVRPG